MTFQIQSISDSPRCPAGMTWGADGACGDGKFGKYIAMLAERDQFITHVALPGESNLMFEVDGVPLRARYVLEGKPHGVLILWGDLGYLPFSMNDHHKRAALIRILEETRRLPPSVQFGIDADMKIVVIGRFGLEQPLTADYVFVPLIRMMQMARPYIRLIGDYL